MCQCSMSDDIIRRGCEVGPARLALRLEDVQNEGRGWRWIVVWGFNSRGLKNKLDAKWQELTHNWRRFYLILSRSNIPNSAPFYGERQDC